jgi:lipoprotein signal peptidase
LSRRGKFTASVYSAAIILGATSNLADRFQYGYVIDYFDLKYFTVFNLADVLIVGGTIGLLWFLRGLDVKKEV